MRGGGKFQKALADLADKVSANTVVRVGIVSAEAAYPDGTKVAQVAAWHEFGTANIPPRPFFRNTIAGKKQEWRDNMKAILVAQDYDVHTTLEAVGMVARDDIMASIRQMSEPANAKSTVAKKGFNNPLIDTGVLLRSMDYQVVEK